MAKTLADCTTSPGGLHSSRVAAVGWDGDGAGARQGRRDVVIASQAGRVRRNWPRRSVAGPVGAPAWRVTWAVGRTEILADAAYDPSACGRPRQQRRHVAAVPAALVDVTEKLFDSSLG